MPYALRVALDTPAPGGGRDDAADVPARAVDFEHPPVNEVAFSVQFGSEAIDEVGILAEFLPLLQPEYPKLEKHPPVPPAVETFDIAPVAPQVQFQLLQTLPSQRYWFLSPDGTRLVQVQADRLMFNWRALTPDDEYPHYDVLKPQFAALLAAFLALPSVAARAAAVSWCELQYINPIEARADGDGHGQLARILRFLVPDPERVVLPEVEDTQIQVRYRLHDELGVPNGRLYLTAVPAVRAADGQPTYAVTLLARGRPAAGELPDSVFAFIDYAHDLIVRGFREATTDAMHALWVEK